MAQEQTDEWPADKLYTRALQAADAFRGGDSRSKNPMQHEVIDFDVSADPGSLYQDEAANILRVDGIKPDNFRLVRDVVKRFELLDMAEAVKISTSDFPTDRAGVINRTAAVAQLIIDDAYTLASGRRRPTFEDFYGAVTGETPHVSDREYYQEILIEMLKHAGIEDVTDKNLLHGVNTWRTKNRPVHPEMVLDRVRETQERLITLTKERLLSVVDLGLSQDDQNRIASGGDLEIKVEDLGRYSGFSLYLGGEHENGSPRLHGLFGMNPHHESQTRLTGIQHLFAHEGYPGHQLQNVVIDLLRRHGKLGFEASMGTMGTPFHVLQEGWAQVVWEILAGGDLRRVADEFGPDLAVELALIVFQDCAKHDASILHQLEKMPIDELQEVLTTRYFLSSDIVKKVSGFWAQDKIFGATVGPTYFKGSEGLRGLIHKYGIERVLPVALHTQGFADFPFLDEKLAQNSTAEEK